MGKFRAVITDTTAKKIITKVRTHKSHDGVLYKLVRPFAGDVRVSHAQGCKTVLSQLEISLNKTGATDIHYEENGASVIVTATIPDVPGVS